MAEYRRLIAKHFVFFGGTAGMASQAAAEEIATECAHIAVVGRDRAAGEDTTQRLMNKGAASATFIRGDLSTIQGAKDAVAGVQGWSKTIDGLVHSAMSAFSGKKVTSDGLG